MTNPKHTDTSRSDLVEAMARAIYEADDPWHVAWPWPDLQSDQAGVDHYRRCAEAAAAVVQAWLADRQALAGAKPC